MQFSSRQRPVPSIRAESGRRGGAVFSGRLIPVRVCPIFASGWKRKILSSYLYFTFASPLLLFLFRTVAIWRGGGKTRRRREVREVREGVRQKQFRRSLYLRRGLDGSRAPNPPPPPAGRPKWEKSLLFSSFSWLTIPHSFLSFFLLLLPLSRDFPAIIHDCSLLLARPKPTSFRNSFAHFSPLPVLFRLFFVSAKVVKTIAARGSKEEPKSKFANG